MRSGAAICNPCGRRAAARRAVGDAQDARCGLRPGLNDTRNPEAADGDRQPAGEHSRCRAAAQHGGRVRRNELKSKAFLAECRHASRRSTELRDAQQQVVDDERVPNPGLTPTPTLILTSSRPWTRSVPAPSSMRASSSMSPRRRPCAEMVSFSGSSSSSARCQGVDRCFARRCCAQTATHRMHSASAVKKSKQLKAELAKEHKLLKEREAAKGGLAKASELTLQRARCATPCAKSWARSLPESTFLRARGLSRRGWMLGVLYVPARPIRGATEKGAPGHDSPGTEHPPASRQARSCARLRASPMATTSGQTN